MDSDEKAFKQSIDYNENSNGQTLMSANPLARLTLPTRVVQLTPS